MRLIVTIMRLVWKSLVFSIKTMAESRAAHDSDVIIPYNFEPDGLWSSNEKVTVISIITIARLVLQSALATHRGALA